MRSLYLIWECKVYLNRNCNDELKEKDPFSFAKNRAYLLLSKKSYSKRALITKLTDKGIDFDIANKVTAYLEDLGYINDVQYASDSLKYLFEIKKFGQRKVVFELYKRGIDKEYAKELAENYFLENESEINNVLQKLLKGKDLQDQKTKRQIFNKLVRMGYDFEEINSAFRAVEN